MIPTPHLMKYEGTPTSSGSTRSRHSARRRDPVTSGRLIHLHVRGRKCGGEV